jgi:hypothetical protein
MLDTKKEIFQFYVEHEMRLLGFYLLPGLELIGVVEREELIDFL